MSMHCNHDWSPTSRSCGVKICYDCGEHKGLVRCFCGWSASGGDGYGELVGMGEQVEEDY